MTPATTPSTWRSAAVALAAELAASEVDLVEVARRGAEGVAAASAALALCGTAARGDGSAPALDSIPQGLAHAVDEAVALDIAASDSLAWAAIGLARSGSVDAARGLCDRILAMRTDLASGAVAHPGGAWRLADAALLGVAAAECGADDVAAPVARLLRRFAWEQPTGVPGIATALAADGVGTGPDGHDVVLAHAEGQAVEEPALAALALAGRFADAGDPEDLSAAIELHDLVVALGDGPFESVVGCAALCWAAAALHAATGEQSVLATLERAAGVLCAGEEGARAGVASADPARVHAGALAGVALLEAADAVERRAPVEALLERAALDAEGDGGSSAAGGPAGSGRGGGTT